jgi:hypothetical protein
MKKKNNPFRMKGPWIGALLIVMNGYLHFIPLFFLGSFLRRIGLILDGLFMCTPSGMILEFCLFPYSPALYYLSLHLVYLTVGFLLGWGIEFLLRKWKWFGLR